MLHWSHIGWRKYWGDYFSITVNANYILQYYYNYVRYTNPKQVILPEQFSENEPLDEAMQQTIISYLLILGAVNNVNQIIRVW